MAPRILLASLTVFIAANALAGWEDTVPPTQQRGASPATARAGRTTPSAQPVQGATHYRNGAPASAQNTSRTQAAGQRSPQLRPISRPTEASEVIPDGLYSAFLDAPDPSSFWYRFTLAQRGDVEGADDGFGFIELDGRWDALEFRNVCYGDVFISLVPSLRILTDDAGLMYMPTVLMTLPVDAAWIWRYLNGWSLEIGATPGIYADAEGIFQLSAISLPFRACLYYNFSEETAVRFGGIVRPTWDQVFMPIVGVAWKPSEMFRMEVGVPQTLAQARFGQVTVYGRLDWLNSTFALRDESDSPDRITFNDWRAGLGVSVDFTDSLTMAFEVGYLAGRDISFDGGPSGFDADVDSAPYFSILVGSEF